MENPTENPSNPRLRRHREYEDPHYHDEDPPPADDIETRDQRNPNPRRSVRRPRPRRYYED